ncbi:VOC family protein [Gordonia zhaorongruii]|uniref:VOC family protein n=1 Tax=Gordonia zhaorongruii TaxID=2597659 RepID=UPI00104D5370|nr:VOC family protein [Gordonia zhaorongruii]
MPDYSAPMGAPVWLDLTTSDADRAAGFYAQVFGWTASDPDPALGGYRMLSARGREVAGLVQAGPDGPADAWSVYFHVADAANVATRAESLGATTLVPAMAVGDLGVMAVLADPAGAAFALWQPQKHPGFTVMDSPGAPCWFQTMTMDFAASTAFYTELFGWSITEGGTGGAPDATGPSRYGLALLDSVQVGGFMPGQGMLPDDHPSFWEGFITVDDAPATIARAVDLGGSVVMEPEATPFGVLGAFKDPMGATISICVPPVGA